MAVIAFVINGQKASVDVAPDTPLLWIVREHLKLSGTKFGCGTGLCGACTVHVDGQRGAFLPGHRIAGRGQARHHDRRAFAQGRSSAATRLDRGAGAAMRLLPVRARSCRRRNCWRRNKKPTREQIVEHMDGNLCRCGTYPRHRPRHPTRRRGSVT